MIESNKRRRQSAVGDVHEEHNSQIGSQLARLYKQIDSADIVMGLYDKYSKSNFTKEAIISSMEGNYVKALSQYDEALDMLDSFDDQNLCAQFEVIALSLRAQYVIFFAD
jgi:hypothetical protein